MLKNIPNLITPELLKILSEMGHGDEIVIADGNFPSTTCGKRVVRLDGHGTKEILRAVLTLIPLDQYVDQPVALMQTTKKDRTPIIWKDYEQILIENGQDFKIENVERYAFYERAKQAYAVITTSEGALYANIILKKGVIVQ